MNFNEKINRLNTGSIKWEMTEQIYGTSDVLPMWIADMDFRPPQELIDAVQKRVEHGIFGYTFVQPSVNEAIGSWLASRHGWTIDHAWLAYASGVVPAIAAAIQAYTEQGDKVLVQPPVYNPFFEMIEANGRLVETSPLVLKNGRYEIDYADFEEALKKGCKLFLLCNPHNPGGRVWTKDELGRLAELCHKYDCLIVSDEIHSDIIFKGRRHVPIASLGEEIADRTVTFIAPSKTFNLGGIQAAAAIISNERLREKFKQAQNTQGFKTLNTFAAVTTEAAYLHGAAWLEALLEYIEGNVSFTRDFLENSLPSVKFVEPDGTYLLWLDCRELSLTDEEIQHKLIEKGKLALEPGTKYRQGGEGFVRMNIACPREVLADGLGRLKKAFS
ncbi:cystathionine beta-lyase [Neobacillus piezotolerans]|uniref:cysteine-S-conjugate beta-lyase n=1 Tax=Neobacillus piezotolerans TaxID=2259171 RepID=A0A3D8GRI7_9BACI|nr:MalY/PatB family protein [Neobacillus piezotolerans]RDU36902.1 cystathionine beta-lyase [Neobacillus piezotolerans]